MPKAVATIDINCPIDYAFDVISDFERYKNYIPEITDVKILEKKPGFETARFDLFFLGMNFYYIINITLERPRRISWTLSESPLLRTVNGSWEFSPRGELEITAAYEQEIEIQGRMPKVVVDTLVNVSAPALLKRFKLRCEKGEI